MKRTVIIIVVSFLLIVPCFSQNAEFNHVIEEMGNVSSVSNETIKIMESKLNETYQWLLKEYGDIIKPEYSFQFEKKEKIMYLKLSHSYANLVQKGLIATPNVDWRAMNCLVGFLETFAPGYVDKNVSYKDSRRIREMYMSVYDGLMRIPDIKNNYSQQNALAKTHLEDIADARKNSYLSRQEDLFRSKYPKANVFEIDYDFSYAPKGEIYGDHYHYDGMICFKNISSDECYVRYNRYFPKDENDSYNRSYPYRITGSRRIDVNRTVFENYEAMLMEIERAYKAKYSDQK